MTTAPGRQGELLSGTRKAAMLLVLLGEKSGGEIVKLLSEHEVQSISREITRLTAISPEDADYVLAEFRQIDMAHDYVVRGGLDYAKKMLNQAFGEDVSRKLVDNLSTIGGEYSNIDLLQKVDSQQLARFIHDEHPQTIAIVLSRLHAAQAAGLLISLPPEMRADIALRMANLGYISAEIVSKIAGVIGGKLDASGDSSRDSGDSSHDSFGGAHALAEIFNRLDAGSSGEILGVIDQHNPNLVETIRNLMFVFPDLLNINVTQMKEIMERIDRKVLTVALKGTSDALRDHFLSTMSPRASEMLREEMESMGPIRIKEVEGAQQEIIALVRQLETEGVVSLKGSAGEQYVV